MRPLRAAARGRVALGLSLLAVLGACSDGSGASGSRQDQLVASVASYDLAVGPPARLIVGLFSVERVNVGYGQVTMRLWFLGDKRRPTRRAGPTVNGRFLALPGSEAPERPRGPALLSSSEGRGVYAAEVGFDRAGFWQVEVTADMGSVGRRSATAAFEVLSRHAVPAPGEPAPLSENLTLSSPGAPPAAIDSRALGGQPVPDPELHQTTIAQARREHRPVLAVFSTPTFCVSRFCGPVTDMVAELARTYPDRAAFVHVEIWKDFEKSEFNETAAEWLTRNGADGNEPWVFLIGPDGRVAARWDNVATRGEIEPRLRSLPARRALER